MDVVKRQLLRRKHSPAVLAGVVIAQQDVLAREALSLKRNVDVFDEPDDGWQQHREPRRVEPSRRTLFGMRHTFEDQHHGSARSADVDRLKGCVEN